MQHVKKNNIVLRVENQILRAKKYADVSDVAKKFMNSVAYGY